MIGFVITIIVIILVLNFFTSRDVKNTACPAFLRSGTGTRSRKKLRAAALRYGDDRHDQYAPRVRVRSPATAVAGREAFTVTLDSAQIQTNDTSVMTLLTLPVTSITPNPASGTVVLGMLTPESTSYGVEFPISNVRIIDKVTVQVHVPAASVTIDSAGVIKFNLPIVEETVNQVTEADDIDDDDLSPNICDVDTWDTL